MSESKGRTMMLSITDDEIVSLIRFLEASKITDYMDKGHIATIDKLLRYYLIQNKEGQDVHKP